MLKKQILTVGLIALLMGITATGCQRQAYYKVYKDKLTQTEMKKEIDLTAQQLKMIHPNFEPKTQTPVISQETFDASIEAIKAQVPRESSPEHFFYILSQVPALLDDSQSFVVTPFIYPNEFIYTGLRLMDRHLYAVHTTGDLKVGDEVIAIGGKSIDALLQQSDAYISNSNAYGLEYAFNQELNFKGLYSYLDVVDKNTGLLLTVKKPSGQVTTIKVRFDAFMNMKDYNAMLKKEDPNKYDPNKQYYDKYYAQNKTNYIRIKSGYLDQESFKSALKAFYRQSKDKGAQQIVIDLRGNGGGKPFMTEVLTSGFNVKTYTDAFGDLQNNFIFNSASQVNAKVYVLIDGGTYGPAYLAALTLQQNKLATIVGTPSGGSDIYYYNNGVLKNTTLTLPSSECRVYVTDTYRNIKALADDKSLMPDILIKQSLEDVLNQEDTALNYILNL